MPRISSSHVTEIRQQVRYLLVQNPHVSARQIAKVLGRDEHFIGRILKKVHEENARRIQIGTVQKDLARIEQLVVEGSLAMREIAFKGKDEKARVMAYDSIIRASKTLLDAKFDAGVYQKGATDVNVLVSLKPHEADLIEKALSYALIRAKPTIVDGNIEGDTVQRQLPSGANN